MPVGEHDKFGLPYRPPCGGWPENRYVLGPMFNHFKRGEAKIQKYHNVTKVPNPTCEDDWDPSYTPSIWPANVHPFMRPDCAPPSSQPGRPGYTTDSGWCDPGHSHGLPCGPWKKTELADLCGTGETQIDLNCYSIVPGEFLDLSLCRKMGFKNVQARHWWYGRFGFEDTDGSEYGASPTGCGLDVPSSPAGTKYRTVRIYASYGQTNAGLPETDYFYSYDRTFTIDKTRGTITASGPGLVHTGVGVGGDPEHLVWAAASAFGNMFCANNHDEEWNFEATHYPSETQTVLETSAFSHSNTHAVRTHVYTGSGPEPADNSVQTYVTEAWLSDGDDAADYLERCRELLAFWDLADDATYPWRMDNYTTVGPLVEYHAVPAAIGPMNGGANGDLTPSDAEWTDPNLDLYSGEVLGKPLPYPGAIAIVQDAGSNSVQINGPNNPPYFTGYQLSAYNVTVPQIRLYDLDHVLLYTATGPGADYAVNSALGLVTIPEGSGLLITTTLPGPGEPAFVEIDYTYDQEEGGHFDFRHETWHQNSPPVDGVGPYRLGFGAWSGTGLYIDPTDYYMPRCATHWTQNNEAQSLFHGAFQWFDGGCLWLQKWAEIKVPRPSQSFFGPCGAQRWKVDPYKVSCFASAGGEPLVVTVAEGDGSKFAAGDKVIYREAPDGGGACAAYTVDSVSEDDVHLGAKIADVPDTWTGGGFLGVLRWPDAWPICGRAKIVSIVANLNESDEPDGNLTVTLEAPCYLVAGDTVDLTTFDGTHLEIIAYSNIPVISMLSDSSFIVTAASLGLGLGDLPTAAHIKSHGAPGYWWLDTNPKGDFLFFQWTHNFRDYVADDTLRQYQAGHGMVRSVAEFSVEQACARFTPCCPSVMCISPNYDSEDENSIDRFVNGHTYGFGDFAPDTRFGSLWQALFRQTMDDFTWSAPFTPCPDESDPFGDTTNCTMTEALSDERGACPADTCLGVGGDEPQKLYYAYRRVVEPRTGPPAPWIPGDAAPALPAGVILNYLTLADLDTPGDPPDGIVFAPPLQAGGWPGDRLYRPNPVGYADAPWALYADMQTCVCGAGRFAADYLADWVICGLLPV